MIYVDSVLNGELIGFDTVEEADDFMKADDLEFLRKSCIKSEKEQINNKIQIVNVFKRFWGRNPSENEVIVAMTGLVLFPEILYTMVKK